MISLAALCLVARADGPLVRCAIGTRFGYIVPEDVSNAIATTIQDSLPDAPRLDGFWTPPEQDVLVCDRVLRELLESAVKDPTILFPDLSTTSEPSTSDSVDYQHVELARVVEHYGEYHRQFVGIVIKGERRVLCNYAIGPDLSPAEGYMDIHKLFAPHRGMHFLQARFDPVLKVASNVSLIGPWQAAEK